MNVSSAGMTIAVAVTASVVTSFFVGRMTARDARPSESSVAEFKEALGDVERALADIRRAVVERPAASGSAPTPTAELRAAPSARPPAAPAATPPADDTLTPRRPAPSRESKSNLLPPADLSRVEEIKDWGLDEDVRRRWFLVSEADALAVFGTPRTVSEWGAGERWDYESDEWGLGLCFLRGRLVMAYSTDKRRR